MKTLPLRRLIIGLRGRYHLWTGRRAYRAGRIRTAGRHLDEALSCGHQSFDMFLLLGKIAYRERDLGRAARFFLRAREADAVRFQLEGLPEDFLTSLQDSPGTAPAVNYRVVIEPRRERGRRARRDVAPIQTAQTLGDFSSQAEWLRYRDLPVLRPGEGADVDWDQEARKLFGD